MTIQFTKTESWCRVDTTVPRSMVLSDVDCKMKIDMTSQFGVYISDKVIDKVLSKNLNSHGVWVRKGKYVYITFRGVATCSSEDTFDFDFGAKLATSRAKRTAYNILSHIYDDLYVYLYKSISLVDKRGDDTLDWCEYEKSYIEKILKEQK